MEHKPTWEMPLRNARLDPAKQGAEDYQIQARTGQFRESTKQFFAKDTTHAYEEAKPFTWIQGDQVGGKSLIWGRQVYRWSDLDFEANLKDGIAVDWPIRYEDIAPWYSYVEKHVGVSGERLGLPQLPDGEFLPPMQMNAGEKHVKAGIERRFKDRHMTIGRVAILTADHKGRAACHYCGPCERGCSTGSYFSTQASHAAPRRWRRAGSPCSPTRSSTRSSTTRRRTACRACTSSTRRRRRSASTRRRSSSSARRRSAARAILLNSKSSTFPNGIANSSGVVGHNLMDHHFRAGASGRIEGLTDHYYQGNRPNGIYIVRFRNLGDAASKRTDFLRGYGYQGSAAREGWGRGTSAPGIGVELKRRLHDAGGWLMSMTAFGECLPRHENVVTLSDKTDDYGIPIIRIDCAWGPNELAMRKDMKQSAMEMLDAAGLKNIVGNDDYKEGALGAEPGLGIHEMGTARMGRDPKTSVLNGWGQAHDVPNLFVTDGSMMTSSSCVNPSITYMALTARAVDYAVNEMKKRNI